MKQGKEQTLDDAAKDYANRAIVENYATMPPAYLNTYIEMYSKVFKAGAEWQRRRIKNQSK